MATTHLVDERQRGRRSAMQEAHVNHSALLHPACNERMNSERERAQEKMRRERREIRERTEC